ncbi:MAG: hypothetical protein U0794_09855 [Isosphaeraceae bacterium]
MATTPESNDWVKFDDLVEEFLAGYRRGEHRGEHQIIEDFAARGSGTRIRDP